MNIADKKKSMTAMLLIVLLCQVIVQVKSDDDIAHITEPKEDWIKIQNWELVKQQSTNNTLYDFLGNEELSDCFQLISQPNVFKFRCYSKYNKFQMTTITCFGLIDGYMCL